jgi:hypothetical protein
MAARQIVPDQNLLRQGIAPNYGEMQRLENELEDQRVEAQQRKDRYNQMLQDAFGTAPAYASNYAASIGLNPNDPSIANMIQQIVGNIQSRAPRDQDSSINPHSYFSPEAFNEGFTDFQSRGRQANAAKVQGAFRPGTESTLLPDNLIDDIVNQIIGEQRGLADTTLGYQSKRGLLTPQGTEQAQKTLSGQESAARSTVTGLARSALDKDRSMIRDIIGEAGSAANNWMLGSGDFSIDPYQQRVQSTAQREAGSFGGDVRAALGSTQLFDIPSLVAQAGQAQGAQNLNVGDPAFVGDKKKTQNRGLGTAGATF